MPKKRGGQPGNKNAFKHGFYSKYFIQQYEEFKKMLQDIPEDETGSGHDQK